MPIQRITSGILADGAIVATDIANGSITTAKIADANVTSSKLASTLSISDNFLANNVTANSNLIVPAGSAGAPSIFPSGDTNTGIFFPAADTIAFAEGGAEAMRIDSSGNVGIGTSSPAAKTEISGSAAANNLALRITNTATDGYSTLQLGDANAGIYRNGSAQSSYAGASSLNIITVGAHPIGFATNNTERMRIDSSGNLLVGTTTSPLISTQVVFFDGSARQGILIKNTVNNASGAAVRFMDHLGNVSGGGIYFSSSNSINYAVSSDYRLKENIVPMTGALAKVQALKPCTFDWKIDGKSSQGFIAHELAEVCPDAVVGEKDAIETYTDEEGNEQSRPRYQGVDPSFLVVTLTAAIQELKAINDAQASRIETLEAKVSALESQ